MIRRPRRSICLSIVVALSLAACGDDTPPADAVTGRSDGGLDASAPWDAGARADAGRMGDGSTGATTADGSTADATTNDFGLMTEFDGVCFGTPTACDQRTNSFDCGSGRLSGCTFEAACNANLDAGTDAGCADLWESTCPKQAACTWTAKCSGTPLPCDTHTTPLNCTHSAGCDWKWNQ